MNPAMHAMNVLLSTLPALLFFFWPWPSWFPDSAWGPGKRFMAPFMPFC